MRAHSVAGSQSSYLVSASCSLALAGPESRIRLAGAGGAAAVAAIFFRFTIPIVLGAFLFAKNIWDWHWFFALLFAAPGLLFMVPAFFASLVSAVKR
ncbi:hypothetical protein [Methylomonas sp. CM2]|uniref:hypothetical protein n=1 Tax=Methylomonas sp. CM2 TaxID=3417647 RepID=UPI003CEFC551